MSGAECLQALNFSALLGFICCPEVEVGAVRLVEVQPRSVALIRLKKVGVAPALIPQRFAPEVSSASGVSNVEDYCSDVHHERTVRRIGGKGQPREAHCHRPAGSGASFRVGEPRSWIARARPVSTDSVSRTSSRRGRPGGVHGRGGAVLPSSVGLRHDLHRPSCLDPAPQDGFVELRHQVFISSSTRPVDRRFPYLPVRGGVISDNRTNIAVPLSLGEAPACRCLPLAEP